MVNYNVPFVIFLQKLYVFFSPRKTMLVKVLYIFKEHSKGVFMARDIK